MIVTDYRDRGWSAEEIVREYSCLTLAEVHSAVACYYDHQQEFDEEIAQDLALTKSPGAAQPKSPILQKLRALKSQSED